MALSTLCINCLLVYKMPSPSYRLDDAMLLESGSPVIYTDYVLHLAVTLRILSMFLYDKVMIFMICSAPIGFHCVTAAIKMRS